MDAIRNAVDVFVRINWLLNEEPTVYRVDKQSILRYLEQSGRELNVETIAYAAVIDL